MTRPWIALVLALAVVGCKGKGKARPAPATDGSAAHAPAKDAPPAATGAQLVPLVWTIEKDGKSSRLVATIDAGIDVDAQVPAAIWDQVKASRTVVLQWNLAEVTMPMLERKQGALSTDLTADEKAKLESAISAKFVADMEHSKPSYVATVVSAYGLPTSNPMQAVINQRAQDAGVPTVYLETAEVQQGLLDRWIDLHALQALIADLDGVKAGNAAVVAAFVKGDTDALAGLIDQRLPWKTTGRTGAELEAMHKATIADRHAAWLVFLKPLLDGGNVLVAVDALDAVGPGGLVEQLAAAGYKVAR